MSAAIAAVVVAGTLAAPAPKPQPPPVEFGLHLRALLAPAPTYRGQTARQWAMRFKHRTEQLQTRTLQLAGARKTLLHRPSTQEAIDLACAIYGRCTTLWRKADCESGYSPTSRNPTAIGREHASGLFQFLPSTFRSTPFAHFSIWSPYANALAAGWMHAQGRGGEWACT